MAHAKGVKLKALYPILVRLSAMGQSRRFGGRSRASGLPRSTDIVSVGRHVSNVPKPEVAIASWLSDINF
jgi:hypothetical protein